MNKLIDVQKFFSIPEKKTLLVRVSEAMDMYEHDSAETCKHRQHNCLGNKNPTLQVLPLALLYDSNHVCFWYDAQPGGKPRLTITESFACFLTAGLLSHKA